MKKYIVTTSIYAPTEALKKFAAMSDWTLIVAGDLKTPGDFSINNAIYLSPDEQREKYPELSEAIGWNCIQRRNLAILEAYHLGADLVALVDDDNIPLDGWGRNHLGNTFSLKEYRHSAGVIDPFYATSYKHLWHRGFPLPLLAQRSETTWTLQKRQGFDVQANFWQGDPDVDALCRMQFAPDCEFSEESFPFCVEGMAPFNSQNTLLTREVLPHYFCFPHIGRMDDIWAAYYVQALGYRVLFAEATVRQERNPHDLTEDMKREFLGYEKTLPLVRALREEAGAIEHFLPEKSMRAFDLYRECFS